MTSKYMHTKIMRNCKARKWGKASKTAREANGTTAKFPLEGPIPALRYGVVCDPASISIPEQLLAKGK